MSDLFKQLTQAREQIAYWQKKEQEILLSMELERHKKNIETEATLKIFKDIEKNHKRIKLSRKAATDFFKAWQANCGHGSCGSTGC